MPTAAKTTVPPKAEIIATQTRAWSTSPIHGKLLTCLDRPHKIGKKAVQNLGNYTLDKEDLKLFEVNDTVTPTSRKKIKNKEKKGKKVFTNGCFDIIHAGHVDYLKKCKEFGQELIVGLNSDRSVTKLKGSARPINNFEKRKAVLIALLLQLVPDELFHLFRTSYLTLF